MAADAPARPGETYGDGDGESYGDGDGEGQSYGDGDSFVEGDVLIDLGENPGAPTAIATASAATASAATARATARRDRLRLAAAAAAVLLFVCLAGSAQDTALRPRWTAPGGRFLIVADTVFVYPVRAGLTARRLTDGRIMWQDPGLDVDTVTDVGRGALGVTSGLQAGNGGVAVTLIDTRSGRRLAVVPGFLSGAGADGVVPVISDLSNVSSCPDTGCTMVTGVDVRTGRQRWQVPFVLGVDYLRSQPLSGQRRLFGMLDLTGHVVLRDLVTGLVVATVTLPHGGPDTHGGAEPDGRGGKSVAIVGRSVLEAVVSPRPTGQPGRVTVTSLSQGGATAWSVTVPLHLPTEQGEKVSLGACGIWLCVFDGGGVILLNPATGAVVRSVEGRFFEAHQNGLVMLWPSGRPDEPTHGLVLLDPVTGAEHPVPDQTIVLDRPAQRSVVVASASGQQLSDVVLRDPAGRTELIGAIVRAQSCAVAGDLLACTHADLGADPANPLTFNRYLSVWPLPRY